MIEGVIVSHQRIIDVPGGNVLHAMKKVDPGCSGFGEAYFSIVESGVVKAWKKHHEMGLNLIVPIGEVRFVLFDDRDQSQSKGCFFEIRLSQTNYNRLTVPAGIWFGFQGVSREDAMLLNIASISHDPDEVERKMVNEIEFEWENF